MLDKEMDAFKFSILKKIQFKKMEATRKKSLIITLVASWLIFLPFIIKNLIIGAYWLAFIKAFFLVTLSINLNALYREKPSVINPHLIVNALILAILSVIYQFGVTAMFWAFPICIVFLFVLPYQASVFYNLIMWIMVTGMAWYMAPTMVAIRVSLALGATVLIALYIQNVIWELTRELVRQMNSDPLTGLYNRRYLNVFLASQYRKHNAENTNAHLLMIDIDHFKSINDRYGHLEGDEVLKKLANHLKLQIRGTDMIFRVGGEEFLIILDDPKHLNVNELSNRLIQSTKAKELINGQSVTISIGMCDVKSADSAMDWLNKADQMLYRAKQQGRNQAVAYDPNTTQPKPFSESS